MATVELTAEQVVALVDQLPTSTKLRALDILARSASAQLPRHEIAVEAALARQARERGQEWASMSEEDRERLVTELVREYRGCR